MLVVTELFGFILEKKTLVSFIGPRCKQNAIEFFTQRTNSPQDKNPNIANLVVAVLSETNQASEVSNFEVHPCILYTDIYCHIY